MSKCRDSNLRGQTTEYINNVFVVVIGSSMNHLINASGYMYLHYTRYYMYKYIYVSIYNNKISYMNFN